MGLGADVGKDAADEIVKTGIPELTQALNAALDRAEKLLGRLDGATITVTIKLGGAAQ